MRRRLFKTRSDDGGALQGDNNGSSTDGFPVGIKLLHEPAQGQRTVVDIVFVHGLTGDREKTWKAANRQHPWPQEILPLKIPDARILTFGYDAYVAQWIETVAKSRIANHASDLLTLLSSYRDQDSTNDRPIIFVCHSLGGLVCELALGKSRIDPEEHIRNVERMTIAIMFLGTPHHGVGSLARIAELFARTIGVVKNTNSKLIEVLQRNSEVLASIRTDFHSLLRTRNEGQINEKDCIQLICCYELVPVPGIGIIVPQDSAILPGRTPISIHKNHMEMTKFDGVNDPGFQAVSGALLRWVKGLRQDASTDAEPRHNRPVAKEHYTTSLLSIDRIKNEYGVPSGMLTSHFVGRDEILDEISRCFSSMKGRVFVLHGTGGVGKTQIALKHIDGHTAFYDMVLWIPADSEAAMDERFERIAKAMDIDNKQEQQGHEVESKQKDFTETSRFYHESLVEQVLTKASQIDGKALIIYDNLDDNEVARIIRISHKPLWKSAIRVLITTRDRQIIGFEEKHTSMSGLVDQLKTDDAKKLLSGLIGRRNTPDPNADAGISEICDFLGNLPLGIHQAGVFINECGSHPQRYLKQLHQKPEATFRITPPSSGGNVYTTFESSFARVRDESKTSYASDWFSMCSFLGPEVPHRLFEVAQEACIQDSESLLPQSKQLIEWLFQVDDKDEPNLSRWTLTDMELSLRNLQRFSLIKTIGENAFTCASVFHPLVQQWSRLILQPEKQEKFLAIAVSLLYVCAENLATLNRGPAYVSKRWLFSHADACVVFCDQVLHQNIAEVVPFACTGALARLYIDYGDCATAEIMLNKALERHRENSRPNNSKAETSKAAYSRPRDIIYLRRTLALALRRQQRASEAVLVQQTALHELLKLGPTYAPEATRALAELAATYSDIRKYSLAITKQNQVVKETEKWSGVSGLDTLREKAFLATIYHTKRDYQQACNILEEVLRDYKENHPNQQAEIIRRMQFLGKEYFRLKRYNDAIAIATETLGRAKEHYGNDDEETAIATHNLAEAYKLNGSYEQALNSYSDALKTFRDRLGETHEMTQQTAEYENQTRQLLVKKFSNILDSNTDSEADGEADSKVDGEADNKTEIMWETALGSVMKVNMTQALLSVMGIVLVITFLLAYFLIRRALDSSLAQPGLIHDRSEIERQEL